MSPKAQRPLRGGAKTLSSPSSRPSGEASVPPPPAGKISAVLYEEIKICGGCKCQLLESWVGRPFPDERDVLGILNLCFLEKKFVSLP